MSPMGLASSLMLDVRCHIVPRFVYATGADFEGDTIVNEIVLRRIAELVMASERLARGLALALDDEQDGRG